MRSLEYRSPRALMAFDVDFITDVEMFRGTCVDVSETGVRARFPLHLPDGKAGSLIMHHPLRKTVITVRVIYLLKNQVGFAFFEPSQGDREVLKHLITLSGL